MRRFTKSAIIISILTLICSTGLFANPRPSRPSRPAPHRAPRVELNRRPPKRRVENHHHHHHNNHSNSTVEFYFPLIELGNLLDVDIEYLDDDLYELYDLLDLEDLDDDKPAVIRGNIDIRIGL